MSSKHSFTPANTKLQLRGLFAGFRDAGSEGKARRGGKALRSPCQLTHRFPLKSLAAAQRLAPLGATACLLPAHKTWVVKPGVSSEMPDRAFCSR